ncbi:PulJ/GspJ family protein [Oligoflexus tunisiensis]|uniref:PulJ/GspJ family protein n=1 Tax=Oligoflexus tunisiensis TaxID=708132 RepID=UPI00114CABA0|nr:hypothetical protein [Oligoflexus tunisiensis]
MRGKRWDGMSGMTLIEFMIGLGILTMIGYGATHFYSRVTQTDAEISAKAKAQSELAALTSLLEKDLKYRDMNNLTDLCPDNLCTQVSIERLAAGGDGTYTVRYTSSCQPLPEHLNDLQFQDIKSQCIKALNCPAGTHPSLAIELSKPLSGGPLYPGRTPPAGQKRSAYNLVGAALCVSRTTTAKGDRERIILEGAFLGSNKMIRVERKETAVSSQNLARTQMLPN